MPRTKEQMRRYRLRWHQHQCTFETWHRWKCEGMGCRSQRMMLCVDHSLAKMAAG